MVKWKEYEYEVAKLFGAKRRKMRKFQLQGPDVNAPLADIEVKLRKKVPSWLWKPLRKAKRWSKSGKLATVVWFQEGEKVEDGIAVLEVKDLKLLLEVLLASQPPQTVTGDESTVAVAKRVRKKKPKEPKQVLPLISPSSPSEPSSPKEEASSKSPTTVRQKWSWKSRRLTSRPFSNSYFSKTKSSA